MESKTIKNATLYLGDCLEVMKDIPTNSIDSIVTDPPYGLKFMGKKWDYNVPSVEVWTEALRVLKPGGHLLSFGGARTYHRLVVNIEDAGFEIRDQIMWLYGSGMPKSLNISKAIDKAAGVKRKVIGKNPFARSTVNDSGWHRPHFENPDAECKKLTIPSTPKAKQWDGWGTGLKPAHEPICVARKPLIGKVIDNVLKHGTGGINIDKCRVEFEKGGNLASNPSLRKNVKGGNGGKIFSTEKESRFYEAKEGRWPANVIHDGSLEVEKAFAKYGKSKSIPGVRRNKNTGWKQQSKPSDISVDYQDEGTASRFFYCAKASKSERGKGNNHPTVKPLALMRYLVRLVTPPEGTILDQYMGSGTTGIAARLEGFKFIGVDNDKESFTIACKRIKTVKLKGNK